jgi:hypothetical protein
MADPTYTRMYASRVSGLREKALREAGSLAKDAEILAQQLGKGGMAVDSSDARALLTKAVSLTETLDKIEVLEEVSYLTTDPDAEEKTDG